MRLACQPCAAPSSDDTVETVTLGGANDVDHLVLGEDIRDFHFLFEKVGAEVDLVIDASTVDLNLLDVSLLLSNSDLSYLSVHDSSDHLAVLLRTLDLGLHGLLLARLIGLLPPLLVLGEALLFRVVPPLVEA